MEEITNLKMFPFQQWDLHSRKTPYFYFDKNILNRNMKNYSNRNFKCYYSVKSCMFNGLIKEVSKNLDGFTVSSIDHLKKVRVETDKPIHFVSPLIRSQEIDIINSLANSLTFNSLEQFNRFKKCVNPHIDVFIRINPEISFVKEERLNPSGLFSQLGIPLSQFEKFIKTEGFHFHNNNMGKSPKDILKTMDRIERYFKRRLYGFQYANLGGGYLWSEELIKTLNIEQGRWKKKYRIKFIIEPGFDISHSAGFLVSSVVDLFKRKGKNIAVLDTSVNHLFKTSLFQRKPKVINHEETNPYSYILAGASCFAGDVFGEYRFKTKLTLGDLVIFKNVGAYSFIKANKFNGIELPKVYMR